MTPFLAEQMLRMEFLLAGSGKTLAGAGFREKPEFGFGNVKSEMLVI